MSVRLYAFPDDVCPARRLAEAAGLHLDLIDVHAFPDGESLPRIPAPSPVAVLYRSLANPNVKLVDLLLAVDALRSNGAHRLVLVAPYLPYMRQDAIFHPGEPISQRVMAGLLDAAFDRIVTVDPHLHRTRSLEDVFHMAACTHLHAAEALTSFLQQERACEDLVVAGPDVESTPWVSAVAKPLGAETLVLTKHRHDDRNVEVSAPANAHLAGRRVLLVDDICSTGGTLVQAARRLKASGAATLTVFVTHALCRPVVLTELKHAGVDQMISSDSCVHPTNAVLLAPLLARALQDENER